MNPPFPSTGSCLCTAALAHTVRADYELHPVEAVTLLHRGENDTYRVQAGDERFIFRVYRTRFSRSADVGYELELLLHLKELGAPVSHPIRRRDGLFSGVLQAPEGNRRTALFAYAPGEELGPEPLEGWRSFGAAVAQVHSGGDSFRTEQSRRPLDLDFLISESLPVVRPFLDPAGEDGSYLCRLADRLRGSLEALPLHDLDWGPIHGDCAGGNAHLDPGNRITLFDFVWCGPGWRAYELGTFRRGMGSDPARWSNFLAGYREARPLPEAEERAAELFVPVRHLWITAEMIRQAPDHGFTRFLSRAFWKRRIQLFQHWERYKW